MMVVTRASVLCSFLAVGCEVGTPDDDANMDEVTLAQVGTYQDATKITARPFASSLGSFDVNDFVIGDVASFRRIHSDVSGSNVTIRRGTVIIREVLDATGHASKLTVMAKGPPGFDPSLGDWWFAVTDVHGVPLVADGVPQLGRLVKCHDCHKERQRDDFLFGVPAAM